MPIQSFKDDDLFLPQCQLQFRVSRCCTRHHWSVFRYFDIIILPVELKIIKKLKKTFVNGGVMSFQMMHFNKNVPHVHIKALWYRLDLETTLSWQQLPPRTCNQGGRSLRTCSSSYQPQLSRHFSILLSRPSFHSHVLTSIWLEMLQPGTRCTLMKTRTLNREDWVLYWHLRQGGKNILMPIFLSEVNGQQPPPPTLTSTTSLFGLIVRIFPQHWPPRVLFMQLMVHGGCRL